MVEPVSASFAIGMTAAAKWAADLLWDLKKGAVGNELHLQLRNSLPEASARFTRDKLPSRDQNSRIVMFNRVADFAAQGTANDD